MKNTLYSIICSIIFCFLPLPGEGQSDIASKYIFSSVSIDEGLAGNFTDDIFKDSHGFIWIATQGGGISRYDGYEFINLNVNSTPIKLKSNFIKKLEEDDFNRLWVASNNGIDIIDLRKMQKAEVEYRSESFDTILNVPIINMFKDSAGALWVISTDRIYKITFTPKGDIDAIHTTDENDKQGNYSCINEIDNEIWVAKDNSIYKISENVNGYISLQLISPHFRYWPNAYISRILKKDNTIWVGTDGGLLEHPGINAPYRHYLHNPNNDHSLSQNMVTDLSIVDGTLVVGTLRGLNFFNQNENNFERISHSTSPDCLNSDFINCLLAEEDNLWIGTESGGINKMASHKLAVKNYIHSISDKNSLSPNPVNAIRETRNKNLWVGTVEGGLNMKKRGENDFIHFTSKNGGLSHNSISALEEDNDNNLWIGTWGGGINILNENKLQQGVYKYIKTGSNFIGILKYDYINNGMWIGTNKEILWYDITNRTAEHVLPDNITNNIRGTLGSLIDDKDRLWIGTTNGLIQIELQTYDKTTQKFRMCYLTFDEQKVNKLFLRNITSIYQAHDKTIWLGSNGYGICKITENNGNYISHSYNTRHGLVNDGVYGILEDEQGLIWISTGRGLSSFNPKSERFINYTKEDGIANNQFYWNASYKSPSSKNLFFGSMAGLTELKNSSQYISSKQRSVTFTKLQVLNNTVWTNNGKYITDDISYAKKLDLHESDKSFSIEFSALDYDNPSTVAYSYRLIGFDDKWIDVPSNRRFASYTNLRPGKYRLQVRCMTKASAWSDKITELEIEIHPFFYKTQWFIFLCILFVLIIAVLFYQWRVNSFKKQREILRQKVEERTHKLEEQKHLLEEQAAELKQQNTVLSDQNEKILYQRKQLVEMSNKVKEAMDDKMSFFTNITHEFRTPITLIIGPIERALKLSTNPKVIEQLHYVARNSKHLLSLVNQLMDFRKVESESMNINMSAGNFINFLDEMLIPFDTFAYERNIGIKKIYRLGNPHIMFDEEAMRKLITNLLSNSIKFTPDNGTVTLYVASIPSTKGDKLYICVQDNGIGIKNEDMNLIFNRFYQSKVHTKYPVYGQSGTGIGLYLCKNIAGMLGGTITPKNNHARGASFRILLPLTYDQSEERIDDEETDIPIEKDTYNPDPIKEPLKQKLTILVVEDNVDMRKYIRSILSDYYNVKEAENGKEALDILHSENIDLIVSDLMMPVMDGLELSKNVKSDLSISHIPFVVLTAKTSLDTRIKSYKTGVDEFLTKPFDEELLLTRIRNILDTRELYQRKFGLYMNIEELSIVEDSNDDKFMKKAMKVIKENYTNTAYDITDFTTDMGVSKSLLNKKMQTLAGLSPGHFIRDFRLSVARELILKNNGNKNISEIAYEVGFNDPKYFTRCFTKHFGVPPSNMLK